MVYAKITDYAGNSTYISSDGFIVDKTPSEITIHPLDREGNEIPKSDNSVYVYNSDYKDGINVKVTVSDPEPSSGVNKIVCRTYLQSSPEKEIQREEYSADQLDDDFLTFRIDPFVSNFSDLVLEVTAQDRAENSNTEICKLDVDTTPPEVAISLGDCKTTR